MPPTYQMTDRQLSDAQEYVDWMRGAWKEDYPQSAGDKGLAAALLECAERIAAVMPTSLPTPATDRQLSDAQEAIDWESDYPQCRNAAVMPTSLPVEEEGIDEAWLRSLGFETPEGEPHNVLWLGESIGVCLGTMQQMWMALDHYDYAPKQIVGDESYDPNDRSRLSRVPSVMWPKTRADVLRLLSALNITSHAGRKGT